MNINKKAFTFVELIVSTVIIIVLTSIWFVSYVDFIWDSRDAQRKSDLSKVSSSLKIYKQKRGYYSPPGDSFYILNQWKQVSQQWKLNKKVFLNTLDKLPSDPKSSTYYSYAVTNNKQEFQLAATLENWETEIPLLEWNYKTISKNILPTLLLAVDTTEDIEIHDWVWTWTINRSKFIFNDVEYNLPYTIESPYLAYNEGTDFATNLAKAEDLNSFWQNNDYRNCTEIVEAGKSISDNGVLEEYQILSDTGALTNTWCTFLTQ
jgi:Tfp pilus assembly protein PilE